jgi:hypothetical protein
MDDRARCDAAAPVPAAARAALDPPVALPARTTDVLSLQRMIGNRAVTCLVSRQATTAARASPQPPDPVRVEVESYFTSFAAATDDAAKNAYAMKAVWAVIRAFKFSTIGLAEMRYDPDFKNTYREHKHAIAITQEVDNGKRESRIVFGPDAFEEYVTFVHVVAHELEHVRQHLFGTYRVEGMVTPVKEFLAYCGMVLQVAPTSSGKKRGLLAELRAAPTENVPQLPPLDVAGLWGRAGQVMGLWRTMLPEERRMYWADFEAVRDKLFERMKAEAPRLLRPPNSDRSSAEFKRWHDGIVPAPAVVDPADPAYNPLSPEFNDWQEASHSLWSRIRDLWKEFDRWHLPAPGAAGTAAKR